MRRTVPQVRCDRCNTETEPTVDSTVVVAEFAGTRPVKYSGENCQQCGDDLREAITALLDEYLVAEKRGTRSLKTLPDEGPALVPRPTGDIGKDGYTAKQRTCPICPNAKPSVTRGAMIQHVRTKHNLNTGEAGIGVSREEAREAKQRAIELGYVPA